MKYHQNTATSIHTQTFSVAAFIINRMVVLLYGNRDPTEEQPPNSCFTRLNYSFIQMYVCLFVCVGTIQCPQHPEEDIRSPRVRLMCGCKLPDPGAEHMFSARVKHASSHRASSSLFLLNTHAINLATEGFSCLSDSVTMQGVKRLFSCLVEFLFLRKLSFVKMQYQFQILLDLAGCYFIEKISLLIYNKIGM